MISLEVNFINSPVISWYPKTVAEWVSGLGSSEIWAKYSQLFRKHRIEGYTLSKLSFASLKYLGISYIHSKVILHKRNDLMTDYRYFGQPSYYVYVNPQTSRTEFALVLD